MSAQQFATLMAVLAIAAAAIAITAVVGRVTRRWAPSPELALTGAWAIAATSMTGSLIFSEVFHFTPCRLCWYQRIGMYPLALLLGIAAARRDLAIRWYAVALAGVGATISTWHVLVQRIPTLGGATSCSLDAPCTVMWVRPFGIFTIPTMALVGFVAIISLLATVGHTAQDEEGST